MANELKPDDDDLNELFYKASAGDGFRDAIESLVGSDYFKEGYRAAEAKAQKQIAALEAKLADALHWKDLLDAKKALGARIVAEAVAAEREACKACALVYADQAERAGKEGSPRWIVATAIAQDIEHPHLRETIRSRTPSKETGADLSGAERKI